MSGCLVTTGKVWDLLQKKFTVCTSLSPPCGEQCTRMELFFAERWDGIKGWSHARAALGKHKRP